MLVYDALRAALKQQAAIVTTAKELPLIALITRVSILPNKMDQALRIAKTSVKPVEQRKGCLGLFIMANHESRELVSLSLWENERSLKAIEKDGFADQHASRLSTVIAEAITGTTYEIARAPQLNNFAEIGERGPIEDR